ncbi:MAG: sterol desaturase family protein [Candidatus Cloacimonetes bacterium]|nr:sterol desaturase family protein [Candidatus Cloacimonadota bacterium]
MTEIQSAYFVLSLCLLEGLLHLGFWKHVQWQTDLLHFLFTPKIVLWIHVYLMAPLGALLLSLLPPMDSPGSLTWFDLIWLWPIADFCGYLVHWLQHKIPFLWRLHRVHHSSTPLNTLAGSRSHPIDSVLQQAFWYLPFFLYAYKDGTLDAEEGLIILTAATVYLVHVVMIHFAFPIGKSIEWLITTPSFHHRHHSINARGNYGLQLTIWDKIFKTAVADRSPVMEYGITPSLPLDWLKHLFPPPAKD